MNSQTSTETRCPYPACEEESAIGQSDRACGSVYRHPLIRCQCGMPNRAAAHFCRACRLSLSAPAFRGATTAAGSKPSFLGMPGGFRKPPLAGNGHLYALATSGALMQLSPRAGARAQEIARLEAAAACFNRSALVEVARPAGSVPAGWVFLAASQAGIDAVSLVDGRVSRIYQPRLPETIAVNTSEADATAFRGIAANSEAAGFVVRNGGGDYTLTIRPLSEDRPALTPVTLRGTSVAGPSLCGQLFVFSTERQVGLYDHLSGKSWTLDFPRDFLPMLTPGTADLAIPPGGMPFAITRSELGGPAVWVAGQRNDQVGMLETAPGRGGEPVFRRLPRGASLTTSPDGTACLSLLDAVEIFARDRHERLLLRTQPSLPVFEDGPWTVSFGEVDFPEQHRLRIESGGEAVELKFESLLCNRDSCCAVYLSSRDVVLAYLDIFAKVDEAGMIFTHWDIES